MIHRGLYISPQDPGYDDTDDIVGTCEACLCAIWAYEPRIKVAGKWLHPDCIRDMDDEKLAEMIGGELEHGFD